MTFQPPSVVYDHYIIVVVDYFTKWGKAMPAYLNNVETTAQFIFNHIIT